MLTTYVFELSLFSLNGTSKISNHLKEAITLTWKNLPVIPRIWNWASDSHKKVSCSFNLSAQNSTNDITTLANRERFKMLCSIQRGPKGAAKFRTFSFEGMCYRISRQPICRRAPWIPLHTSHSSPPTAQHLLHSVGSINAVSPLK